jgi:hypothetical protein
MKTSPKPRSDKPRQTLYTLIAEIATVRATQGLPPLAENELPKTMNEAEIMLAELRKSPSRLPSNIEPSSITSLKRPVSPSKPASWSAAVAVPKSTLPSLETISSALKDEANPSARLTYLNKAVASYREAVVAEKDFGKQTELCRQKAKVERAQAYEMQRQGKLRDAYKFPTDDLA